MAEDNSMSERILRNLESIFESDPFLREFTIIPTPSNTINCSPVVHMEHNLALESWCIKHIYKYVYQELFDLRRALRNNKIPQHKLININRLLIGALLINPDVTTFWNMKRELINYDVINIDKELLFTKIVLSYKNKSNEAFFYRKWLIHKILIKVASEELFPYLREEFEVCEMAANKSANNYHAWTHRIWCLRRFLDKIPNFLEVLSTELDFISNWLSLHVSEHSGYHYKQHLFETIRNDHRINAIFLSYYSQVVKYLNFENESDPSNILIFLLGKRKSVGGNNLEESNKYVNYFSLLLFDLFYTSNDLNETFPGHESLFYHRRYLLHNLIKAAYQYHNLPFKPLEISFHGSAPSLGNNFVDRDFDLGESGEKQPKLFKSQPNLVKTSYLYELLIKLEAKFLKKQRNSCCLNQNELAKKHEKWLKLVLRLQN